MLQRRLTAAILSMLLAVAAPAGANAQGTAAAPTKSTDAKAADEPHRKEDIARHRQMARAHEEAARCLETGEKETVCQERLRAACAGIAVGRYCGMRHAH